MRYILFSYAVPAAITGFFIDIHKFIPGHEQPHIFHWKYARRWMDFNFGHIMPDSEAELRKGCDVISPPEPGDMVVQNERV